MCELLVLRTFARYLLRRAIICSRFVGRASLDINE